MNSPLKRSHIYINWAWEVLLKLQGMTLHAIQSLITWIRMQYFELIAMPHFANSPRVHQFHMATQSFKELHNSSLTL
jgi:hypothetical protein